MIPIAGQQEKEIVLFKNKDGSTFAMAQIREYVVSMARKREDVPEPTPTDAQPLPEDKNCRWCTRSRRHHNTIRAGPYIDRLFLPFKSPTAHECIPCCRAQSWGLKSKTREELTAMVETEGSDDQVLYMFVLFCWEVKFLDPNDCIIHTVCQEPPACLQKITQDNTTSLESGQCMGYLWPTPIFIQHFEYRPNKKSLHTITHNGKKVTGVILSPSFGLEIGVIKLQQKCAATLGREWTLASNDDQILADSMDDIWARGQHKHRLTVKGEKSTEGEVSK